MPSFNKINIVATLTYINALVLCGSALVSVVEDNCPFKECRCKKEDISCQKRGLTEIPHLIGNITGHKYLTMQTNNITKIPYGSLPSNLVSIDMTLNPVTTVDEYAFNNSQKTLQVLSFSEAKFTRIPDALLHLRVLKSLTLEDTSIKDWNDAAMKNIAPTLIFLELINVSMHTWPTWMQFVSNLTYLNLQSNFIAFIPDDALDMMASTLTTLDLNSNNLTSIPKTIQKLTVLQSLYLDNNAISYTPWLPMSSTLVTLSLTNTHLVDAQNLSNSLMPYAQSLINLVLVENNLSEIPDVSFLTNIDYFDFSQNKISNPFAGSVPSIVNFMALDYNFLPVIPRIYSNVTSLGTIQMTYNLVREIRGTDIPAWIRDIELSYNLITELTDTSFPDNCNVLSLSLVSNPIVTISQNAFKNLELLTSLDLQNTKLTRVPLSLASLIRLTWIDMDGNLDLVCTCQEKSLRDWILGRQMNVIGSCGVASIAFFFENLSPSCP